jgi:hypothetical protein
MEGRRRADQPRAQTGLNGAEQPFSNRSKQAYKVLPTLLLTAQRCSGQFFATTSGLIAIRMDVLIDGCPLGLYGFPDLRLVRATGLPGGNPWLADQAEDVPWFE